MDEYIEQVSRYVGNAHAQRATDRLSGIDARFNNVMQTVRYFAVKISMFI